MAQYGYARVSSREQNLDRQLNEFSQMELTKIYADKESGGTFNRKEYKKMLRVLHKGDVVFVWELNRFGRNYDEIKEQWYYLTKIRQVDIVVLGMPLLDTRATAGNLLNKFIADLVLQILAYVAEQQLLDNRKAQAEGIAAAKAKGVQFGRPRKKIDEEIFIKAVHSIEKGEMSFVEASRRVGMSRSGFRRRYEEYRRGYKTVC